MKNKLKTVIRELLPLQFQVPVKYYYNRFNSMLEPEMKVIKFLVKKDDLVIDVGANRGVYAYRLWKQHAKIEVFEPNPACLRPLDAWAAGKPDVNVHSVALSDRTGSANLRIPFDEFGVEHDASASIEHDGFKQARDQLVSLRTLDSYHFDGVRFIKIDVEGHESRVIEGATVLLTSSMPALLVEIEQRHNERAIGEVFEKILDFGYQGYFMEDDRWVALAGFDESSHQSMEKFRSLEKGYINNFLFLHRDRLADGEYEILFECGLL